MSVAAVNGDKLSKPFSLSFGSRTKPPASKVNAKKRNYATLTADESGEDEEAPVGKAQAVHSFDQAAGGAVAFTVKEEKGPLVINAQKNLDWRDEARRRRGGANLLPAEEQARRSGDRATNTEATAEKEPVYGLLKAEKREIDQDVLMEDVKIEVKPKTKDEEALDALLGKKESSLIIEQAEQENTLLQTRTNDAQAFRADIALRPESASLADYEAVPIEEFGLALLRGQGYKEGDPIGRRKTAAAMIPHVPQRRANLLGIGAKEVPEGLEEMGAWGKGAKKKGNKIDRSYNPLVMRNRVTGELLSQAELQARKEQQTLVLDTVQEKKARRHRDRDEEKYDSSRHSSSRRDRSRSRGHKEHRQLDYDRSGRDSEDRRSPQAYDNRRDRRADRDSYERSEKESRRSRHENDSSRHERQRDEEGERSHKDYYRERSHREKRRHD